MPRSSSSGATVTGTPVGTWCPGAIRGWRRDTGLPWLLDAGCGAPGGELASTQVGRRHVAVVDDVLDVALVDGRGLEQPRRCVAGAGCVVSLDVDPHDLP